MNRHQNFRVLVRKAETFSIDIPARSGEHAIERARNFWSSSTRHRFDNLSCDEPVTFEVDDHATGHLADLASEDRARWALTALRAFADKTGSQMGREALCDLLTDLGHYAAQNGLDFEEELRRACATLEHEKGEEVRS